GLEQAEQALLEVVLALVKLPLGVAGPQQGHGAAAQDGGRHQGVEGADLDPVQRYQQGARAPAQACQDAGHAVGDTDPAVGAEPPDAFDPVFAAGGAVQTPAEAGEADAAEVDGGGDEGGQGFGLAAAQAGAYGEDPGADGGGRHGGSSAGGRTRVCGYSPCRPQVPRREPPPFIYRDQTGVGSALPAGKGLIP